MKKSLLLTLALALVLALCCAVASAEVTCSHANLSTVTTTEPKCGVAGAYAVVCVDCGTTIKTGTLNPLTHNYVEIACVPATCLKEGISLTKCTFCGDEQSKSLAVDNKNHVAWGEWTTDKSVARDCTKESGWQYRNCKCGASEGKSFPAGEHTWGEWIEDAANKATCTEAGWQYRICSVCGTAEGKEKPKLGHDWTGEWIVTEKVTCVADGWQYKICQRKGCNETKIEKIEKPASGHDFVEIGIERIARTCDTRLPDTNGAVGLVIIQCKRCEGKTTKPYYLEHEVVNEVKAATCCTPGIDKSSCQICGMVFHEYSTSNFDLNNHDYKENWVEVKKETCYSGGKYDVYCTGCRKFLREDTKAAVAHGTIEDHGSKTFRAGVGHSVDPTCEKVGKDVYICSKCWYSNNNKVTVVSEKEIPATGHKWEFYDMTKAPTCRETGINLYVCVNPGCGKQYEVELPKLQAHPVTVTTINAAKCGVAGVEKKECYICHLTWFEVIPALEHEKNEGKQTVAPTCDMPGEMAYVCKLCNKEFTEVIPELGHNLGNYVTVKAATCTENGIESAKCSRCEYTHNRDIKATGHNYVCVVDNPTCTETGLATYTCLNCGDTYTEIIPARGHDYATVIVREATINRNGEKADICETCGDKQNVQKIAYTAMQFGANMSLDGIKLSELDPTKTSDIRVAVVDTTVDGTYTFNLVADNKWTIGTATVTVANGTVTVNYRVDGFKVKNETITVFSSLDALKANEGIAAANGQPVAFSGNTAFIALDAIVDFCHGDYRVNNYNENTKLIADMKALIA